MKKYYMVETKLGEILLRSSSKEYTYCAVILWGDLIQEVSYITADEQRARSVGQTTVNLFDRFAKSKVNRYEVYKVIEISKETYEIKNR